MIRIMLLSLLLLTALVVTYSASSCLTVVHNSSLPSSVFEKPELPNLTTLLLHMLPTISLAIFAFTVYFLAAANRYLRILKIITPLALVLVLLLITPTEWPLFSVSVVVLSGLTLYVYTKK
ncbi:hypothetical protein Ahos_2133 [Acidianus hospitalis W1]|uniref:Uncharacterized protein n=1 Tax=Acidianus hospitalis (strain W1) TaxID=933801 RepID=F4B8Y1_ACIHW|nr:hypothetical protein Ahos_2133 [Acidianus hospitalis W1]